MKRYKMVMFDMDGTLMDSFNFHAGCFQRFLRGYGVRLERAQVARLIGNTLKTILTNTIPESRHAAALRDLSAFYRTEVDDLIDELNMVTGGVETIARIKHRGLWTTLLTNSKKELVERISYKKGFDGLFDMMEAADNNSLNKESRCHKVLDAFGVQPSDVLYIGDSSHDIALARTTGMTGCLIDNDISWLHHEGLTVADISPDIVVDDISKVLELI